MVSVNFKNSANKSAAEIAATTKPSVTIDIMSSPYQVIEASPEPIVDVYRLVFIISNQWYLTYLSNFIKIDSVQVWMISDFSLKHQVSNF